MLLSLLIFKCLAACHVVDVVRLSWLLVSFRTNVKLLHFVA